MLCSKESGNNCFQDEEQSMAAGIFDHCPLNLGLHDNIHGRGHFHFMSFWPSLDSFEEVVANTWVTPHPLSLPDRAAGREIQRALYCPPVVEPEEGGRCQLPIAPG